MAGLVATLAGSAFHGVAVHARPARAARAAPAAAVPVRASQQLQGKVVSTSMNKTVAVAVESLVVHPIYKKRMRSTTKFMAHDEEERCKLGDTVLLSPCRPLSKSKKFVVESIVAKN